MHLELQLPLPVVVTTIVIVEPVVVVVVVIIVVVTDDSDGKMNVSHQKYSHHMFTRSSHVVSQSAG